MKYASSPSNSYPSFREKCWGDRSYIQVQFMIHGYETPSKRYVLPTYKLWCMVVTLLITCTYVKLMEFSTQVLSSSHCLSKLSLPVSGSFFTGQYKLNRVSPELNGWHFAGKKIKLSLILKKSILIWILPNLLHGLQLTLSQHWIR